MLHLISWPHLMLDHAVISRQVKLAVLQVRRLQRCNKPRLLQLLVRDLLNGPGIDPAAAGALPPVPSEGCVEAGGMSAAAWRKRPVRDTLPVC